MVATVQTAKNCIDQLAACRFSLVIVDEAHHSVADTYKSVLKGLGFLEEVTVAKPRSSSSSSSGSAVSSSDEDQPDDAYQSNSSTSSSAGSSSSNTGVIAVSSMETATSKAESCSCSSSSSDPYAAAAAANSDGDLVYEQEVRAVFTPHALLVGFTATPYR